MVVGEVAVSWLGVEVREVYVVNTRVLWSTTMKMSHRLQSHSAGPVWGLVMGMFLVAIGIVIWIYAKSSQPGDSLDESLAMAAMLVGVFLAVYAGREISRARR